MTAQKRGEVGSIAVMSRLIRITIVGTIPAITAFMDSHSGNHVPLTALQYPPPSMSFMKRAWNISRPHRKPAMYSTTMSNDIGNPKMPVIAATQLRDGS